MSVATDTKTTEAEAVARFPVGAKVEYHEFREGCVGVKPESASFGRHMFGGRVIGHEGSVVLIRRYRKGTTLRYDLDTCPRLPTEYVTSGLKMVDAPLVVPKPPSPKQVALKAKRRAAVKKTTLHLYDLLFEYGGWKEASPAQREELLAANRAVAAAKRIGRKS
jgi:hypothetical protein